MSFFFETVEIGWPSASSRQGYAWRSGLTQGGHRKASIKNPDIGKDSPCASRIKPPLSPAPPAVSARKSLYLHSSTLRILYRVAERFHESFTEGGWNFHVIPVVPGH
jgi:hypothetical protein